MNYTIYWLRLPEYTDIFSQGYVGITNNIRRRFNEHRNSKGETKLSRRILSYGWDTVIKEILIENLDKKDAILLEEMLRPVDNIGWNVLKGGFVAFKPKSFNKE